MKRADAARKAGDARLAAEARNKPADPVDPARSSDPMMNGGGSTGVPSTGVVSTGDAQLDRAQAIDINGIRDQRVGGSASGIQANDPRNPAVAAAGTGAPPPMGAAPNTGALNGTAANGAPMQDQQPKKVTPIYKKWWFWAVVAVSAYVVYSIASDSSSSTSKTGRLLPMPGTNAQAAQPGGYTLMRW